jgi:hypothetical protein
MFFIPSIILVNKEGNSIKQFGNFTGFGENCHIKIKEKAH